MMMYDTRNSGFRGLLRLLLALVVGLWVVLPAHASFPATPGGTGTSYRGDGTMCAVDYASACALIGGVLGAAPNYYCSNNYSHYGCTLASTCPSNSIKSGSTCTCSPGYTQSGSTCVVDPCYALSGTSAGEYSSPGSVSDGKYVYLCEVGLTASCGLVVDYSFSADGVKTGHAKWSGQSCTPGTSDGSSESNSPPVSTTVPPEPGKPAPTPCKPGTFPGTVNGQSVCIEPSDKAQVETKKKTVEDDGTNTVKKETSTVCAAGACNTITTTTTTNNSTSSVNVTNNTKSEAKSDYCAANPNSSQCSVECQSDIGTAGCAKLSKPVDGELPTSDVDVPTVQVDGLAGFNIGHACPADLTYIIQGKSYSLSFKAACDVAHMVKPVVLLGAALSALFIVYASLVGKTS